MEDYDNKSGGEVGRRVYDELKGLAGETFTSVWIPNSSLLRVQEGEIELVVQNQFQGEMITHKKGIEHLRAAAEGIGISNPKINVVVDAEKYDSLFPRVKVAKEEYEEASQGTASAIDDHDFKRGLRRLNFTYRDRHTNFSDLIVSGCNENAIASAKGFIEDHNGHSIYFVGPHGAGKTAILATMMNSYIREGVLPGYVDLREVIDYLKRNKGKFPPYLRDITDSKVIVIDGLEDIVGELGIQRPGTRKKAAGYLLHGINRGKPIVGAFAGTALQAREGFEKLRVEDPAFADRLDGLVPVVLGLPSSDKDKKDFVRGLLLQRGLTNGQLDPVTEYISEMIPVGTSIRTYNSLIEQASLLARGRGEKLTLDIAQQALGESQRSFDFLKPRETAEMIIQRVADSNGISVGDITGKRRDQHISTVRDQVALELRDSLDLSYQAIGNRLGNRNHSTILSAVKRARKKAEEKS